MKISYMIFASLIKKRSRAQFWSITNLFSISEVQKKTKRNVAKRLESSRPFANSEGVSHCSFGAEFVMSMQAQIVNALHLGERDKAAKLLSNLSMQNDSLGVDDFIYILDYCARSPDPLFIMETYRIMEEKEIGLNKRCCMYIIQSLVKGGYLEEAFNWLTFLGENHHTNPDLPMFNTFLNGCAQMRSMAHANNCLDLMEGRLMGKSEETYWELVKLAVWQKNLSAVHEIWEEFSKFYSPSITSLRRFIRSFSRLGDLESAYEALQQMVVLALQGSASIKRLTEGKIRSSRLDIPIPSNSEFDIKRCSRKDNGQRLPYSLFTNDSTRTEGILRDGHMDIYSWKNQARYGMYKCLNRSLVEADKGFGSLFPVANYASAFVQSGGFKMLQNDIDTEPIIKVLRWSFSDVIHACAQSRNSDLAEQLLLQMHNLGLEPSCHTYDGFIRAVVSEKGVTHGMKVVKIMEYINLKPYKDTLATLSIGCSKILELDLAESLLEQMVECPYLHPFNALLAACSVMDQPERAVRLFAKMKQLKLKSDIRTYELLFSLLGNVNAPYEKGNMLSQVDTAKRINAIEADMVKNGVQHSQLSMKNLLKALGAEGKLTDMINYLHTAEDQLFWRNTYPGTAIYNTVLHSLVKAKERHMAIEVFKYMKLVDLRANAGTYNIMIYCCSTIKCYKSACALLSMMLRDGFCPQACTYTALIKILLANKKFGEALRLLDQVSMEGIQPDVQLYNNILFGACRKGRLGIIERIVERMHQERIQPDPSTCYYVFSTYVKRGFLNMAMEALQVLSMWMISVENSILQEKRKDFEDFVLAEDEEAALRINNIFRDSGEYFAVALLNLRLCAIAGFSISWLPDKNPWARRLSSIRNAKRTAKKSRKRSRKKKPLLSVLHFPSSSYGPRKKSRKRKKPRKKSRKRSRKQPLLSVFFL